MRAFNFSPGPAALPLEVLEQARDEMLDWNHGGMSVMEVSHRGKAFMETAAEAEADLRQLMSIPANYRVLFMQGGASAQFAIIPMNLTHPKSITDYVNTGHWSNKAILEARRYCRVHVAGDGQGQGAPGLGASAHLRVPPHPLIRRETVSDGFDAADDRIAEGAAAAEGEATPEGEATANGDGAGNGAPDDTAGGGTPDTEA